MLKVIAIDDSIHSLELIKHLLQGMADVEVAATYTDAAEALKEIKTIAPDIIFLDIEMPNYNGIEVANEVWKRYDLGEIVFVSAHDHYALEAYGVRAIDYLLKPIHPKNLAATIEHIRKRRMQTLSGFLEHSTALSAQLMDNFILYDSQSIPIKFRTKKVKELCAYLLHHQQHPVHKAQIIEDLWPEHSMEKANNSLHVAIYQLRKQFKEKGFEDSIKYIDEKYVLQLNITNDLQMIETLFDSTDADKIFELVTLYDKGYLEAEDFQWARSKAQLFRNKFILKLETELENFQEERVAKAQHIEACLQKLIEMEPFNEGYVHQLVHHYIAMKQITKAKAYYENYAKMIWEDLGEKPSLVLSQLIESS